MFAIARILRRQGDGGDEAGGDDGAAQILHIGGAVGFAGFEASHALEMAGAEHIIIVEQYLAEAAIAAGRDDDVEIAIARFMVDPHFGFVYPGEGIAIFAQRRRQRGLARQDAVGVDRIARLHREGAAQRLLPRAGFGETGNLHRVEEIKRARRDIEDDGQLVAAGGRRRDASAHPRGIIAVGAQ